MTCHVCNGARLEEIEAYRALARVSSDCKVLASGGELLSCFTCGALQKPLSPQFLEEIKNIYADYDIYHQGGGAEQMVFDAQSGTPLRRSQVLAKRLKACGFLPEKLSVLDVGCGKGAFLRALSQQFETWRFQGLELDRRHEGLMADIRNLDGLLVADVKNLAGNYDVITLVHALEHFVDPYDTLVSLRKNLTGDGILFIQIPNVRDNPFDLLIADHVLHFTPDTLRLIVERAGYEVLSLQTDWVKKELSLLARPAAVQPVPQIRRDISANGHVDWLADTLSLAKESAQNKPFGLFGTSIAATWLTPSLDDAISFYVDDDKERQARGFANRPVFARENVPDDATVFAALSPAIAETVAGSLRQRGIRVITP